MPFRSYSLREHYLGRLASPLKLAPLLAAIALAGYIFSAALSLPIFISQQEVFAFSMRLSCIFSSVLSMRFIWTNCVEVLNSHIGDADFKTYVLGRLAKAVNDPTRHALAAAAGISIYYAVVFVYVVPFLNWKLAHLVVNTLWSGVVGVGAYVGFSFANLLSDISPKLRVEISKRVDPYHPDGFGGLRDLAVLVMKVFIIGVLMIGLLIGAVPYAFNIVVLSVILAAGNVIAFSLLIYCLFILHRALNSFKHEELKRLRMEILELNKKLKESFEEHKPWLRIAIIEKELYHIRINELKTWPLKLVDILGFLGMIANFLPLILQLTV